MAVAGPWNMKAKHEPKLETILDKRYKDSKRTDYKSEALNAVSEDIKNIKTILSYFENVHLLSEINSHRHGKFGRDIPERNISYGITGRRGDLIATLRIKTGEVFSDDYLKVEVEYRPSPDADSAICNIKKDLLKDFPPAGKI